VPGVVVRRLERPEEFVEAVEVQRSAWRMNDYREAAPAHLLRALASNGGLVLGAFDSGTGEMLGVSYGWPAHSRGGWYFYSHATGVREDSKYRGVGFQLKTAQRREALSMGLRLARWTFDPLQPLNSRFNLSKLGVVVRSYALNYYGEIRDNINRGLPSDRAFAEWYLDTPRVRGRLRGTLPPPGWDDLMRAGGEVALPRAGGQEPGEPRLGLRAPVLLVALPASVEGLRASGGSMLLRWRLATRRVYTHYLERGYLLAESVRGPDGPYNVLVKADLEDVLSGSTLW
jgi:chorismate synthase